jgi:hypothetical protein
LTRIERLQKRLDRISPPTKPEANLDAKAKAAWVLDHLTLGEESELIEAMKAVQELRPGQASEAQLDCVHSIMLKGEERAEKQPAEAWEEYKRVFSRAETLRNVGRIPTEAEALERQELSKWLDDLQVELEARLNAES